MFRGIRFAACWLSLVAALAVAVPLSEGQAAQTPIAPIPSPILAAKKVFVSNGGADLIAWRAVQRAGTPNEPHSSFYAAMKSWGRYELVNDPAEADLIFEVRFGAPLLDTDKVPTYGPNLRLTILDGKTHFILWSILEPVEGAYRKATWLKNYSHGIDGLMEQLKKLTS